MRVAIVSSGRFHVLDLARELDKRGHEVKFYSLVPPWRTRNYGLPKQCNRWLGPYVAPLYASSRGLRNTRWASHAQAMMRKASDAVAGYRLEPCDVVVGMSGTTLAVLEAARRRFGATVFVERASRHVLSQKAILDGRPRALGGPTAVTPETVQRELAGYELSDVIVVPSRHVEASFVERGVNHERLFRNPLGVCLEAFPASPRASPTELRLLMVGTWSWQKGVDLLLRAFRILRAEMPRLELWHVGPVGDVPLPLGEPGFVHHAPVPQAELPKFYRQCDVLALPSRQDGFGMVLSQALASGVPVVCSEYTGGLDLREVLGERDWVHIVPVDDAVQLAATLGEVLAAAAAGRYCEPLQASVRAKLSWEAYGERWHQRLSLLGPSTASAVASTSGGG